MLSVAGSTLAVAAKRPASTLRLLQSASPVFGPANATRRRDLVLGNLRDQIRSRL